MTQTFVPPPDNRVLLEGATWIYDVSEVKPPPKHTIPIVHCLDDNFVIPASVAIYSLLQQANRTYRYLIYVLHSNITGEHQSALHQTISGFDNAELVFIDMRDRFAELFERTGTKGHYSKEMFYKLLVPSLFPDHEKILVSDVDVVFLGDVSRDFLNFNADDDIYLAGSPGLVTRKAIYAFMDIYKRDFTDEEIGRIRIGAGYYVANLSRMRSDGLEEKFLKFAHDNAHRLIQPEQDVLNLVCPLPRVRLLPADSMVCSYSYDLYLSDADFEDDLNYSAEEVRRALAHPVQLHYAGIKKPWSDPGVTKGDAWHNVLRKTPFYGR